MTPAPDNFMHQAGSLTTVKTMRKLKCVQLQDTYKKGTA